MTMAANEALVVRLVETWNGHDLAAMADFVTDDYIHHTSQGTDITFAGFRQGFAWLSAAFPDLRHTIRHFIGEGDTIAIYCHATGTHQGTFFDLATTGRRVSFLWMYHCRILNGRISEDWDVMNFQAMLTALRAP